MCSCNWILIIKTAIDYWITIVSLLLFWGIYFHILFLSDSSLLLYPLNIQFIFYGFCGFGVEDAIAIDNIMVKSNDNSSTTTTQQQKISSTTVPTKIVKLRYPRLLVNLQPVAALNKSFYLAPIITDQLLTNHWNSSVYGLSLSFCYLVERIGTSFIFSLNVLKKKV